MKSYSIIEGRGQSTVLSIDFLIGGSMSIVKPKRRKNTTIKSWRKETPEHGQSDRISLEHPITTGAAVVRTANTKRLLRTGCEYIIRGATAAAKN